MGVTSCKNLCGDSDSTIKFNESNIVKENYKNKSIVHIKLSPEELYSQKFEETLSDFGEFFNLNLFNQSISDNIKNYTKENPLKIPDDIKLNGNNFEQMPVKFKNGNIFYGSWNKEYKMEGLGKYYILDENIYIEGIWENGILIYGRLFYDNEIIYEGYIKDSKHNGKGKLIYNNGDICKGEFLNGEIIGKCIYIFKDGTKYEGEIEKNNNFKGNGIMTWVSGIKYEGEFYGPILNDYGILKDNNGEIYEGYFLNNYFNGKGKYTFNDGSIYKGEFELGNISGKGKYIKIDKFEYEGNWINNLPNNFGKFSCNEFIIEGIWRNGKNIEITNFEKGDENNLVQNILNFKVEKFNLIPQSLPNLIPMNYSDKNITFEIE